MGADFSTFSEDFSGQYLDGSTWDPGAFESFQISGNVLTLQGHHEFFRTVSPHDLRVNSYLQFRLESTDPAHTWEVSLSNAALYFSLEYDGSQLKSFYYVSGGGGNHVEVPYDPVAMRYLRFSRYTSPVLDLPGFAMHTSPDGQYWTMAFGLFAVQVTDGTDFAFQIEHGGEVTLQAVQGGVFTGPHGDDHSHGGPPAFDPTVHLQIRYTAPGAGAGNTTAGTAPASLGGYVSTTVTGVGRGALFDDLDDGDNENMAEQYRAVAVVNTHPDATLRDAVVFLTAEAPNGAQIALATDGHSAAPVGSASAQAATVSTEYLPPAGTSLWQAPTHAANGVPLGDLPGGMARVVWVRRTALDTPAAFGGVTLSVCGSVDR